MDDTVTGKRELNSFLKNNSRLILSAIMLILLAVIFWSGSRYPALNEKALMGGNTPLSGLSFDIVLDIFPGSSVWWEIVANFANWISTNLKGMTFGVLFGAAMLTLLSVVKNRSFENGFANAALGAVIGAPLGVCVNCAAPIALGLHMGRMRLETTLAALIASPTLNVIVVTMSFALLPMHVAATKLGLSLAFILLIIPLLCKYWLKAEIAQSGANMAKLAQMSEAKGLTGWIARALTPQQYDAGGTGFFDTGIWYVKTFGRNLFFIAVITVPMMFLAALLGAVFATFLDTSALTYILPGEGHFYILLAMVLLAAVVTFAPAPIALDIILTAILLGVGLSTQYATVVVIALGTFSIYAFIILWRAISPKTALTLWLATIGLAVSGGIIANLTGKYERAYYDERAEDYLLSAPVVELPKVPELSPASSNAELAKKIVAQKLALQNIPASISSVGGSDILLRGIGAGLPETPVANAESGAAFARIPGQQIGLDELGVLTPLQEIAPNVIRGGIAAGDIHGDGWVDIIVPRPTGATGLTLYANIGGRFERQQTDLGPVMRAEVINVAFADMDNDSQLDLIAATVGEGLFVFYNQGGFFSEENSTHISMEPYGLVMSFSFADMDQDSDLDIVIGRWAHGSGREHWSIAVPDISTNQVVWNQGDRRFTVADMPGSAGQTLTTLIDDFNGDGYPDVLKGDDVAMTDQILYFTSGQRTLPLAADTQIFPYFMRTSMSYDSGDWNNDLRRDYYGAQVASGHRMSRDAAIGDGRIMEICQQFGRDEGWDIGRVRNCAADLKSIDQIRGGKGGSGGADCGKGQSARDAYFCYALEYQLILIRKTRNEGTLSPQQAATKCENAFARLDSFLPLCASHFLKSSKRPRPAALAQTHAPGLGAQNILMTQSPAGVFADQAKQQGVLYPGWSWNSRFVDLDQNGWQDMLVMTGVWMSPSRSMTNVFYHNDNGQFREATDQFGFTDILPSYSYASFDYDRDGDIDVIRDPSSHRMIVHRNDRPAGKALWVHLRDGKGNSMGIGATVTVCTDGVTRIKPGKCQMRDIKASGGFQSFDPIAAHFGLGQSGPVSLIEVRWGDGEVSRIEPQEPVPNEIRISRK